MAWTMATVSPRASSAREAIGTTVRPSGPATGGPTTVSRSAGGEAGGERRGDRGRGVVGGGAQRDAAAVVERDRGEEVGDVRGLRRHLRHAGARAVLPVGAGQLARRGLDGAQGALGVIGVGTRQPGGEALAVGDGLLVGAAQFPGGDRPERGEQQDHAGEDSPPRGQSHAPRPPGPGVAIRSPFVSASGDPRARIRRSGGSAG